MITGAVGLGGGLNSNDDSGDTTGGFLGVVTGGFFITPGGGLNSAVGDLRYGCDDEDEDGSVVSPLHDLDLACIGGGWMVVGDGGSGVSDPLPEYVFLWAWISVGLNTLRNVGTAAGADLLWENAKKYDMVSSNVIWLWINDNKIKEIN